MPIAPSGSVPSGKQLKTYKLDIGQRFYLPVDSIDCEQPPEHVNRPPPPPEPLKQHERDEIKKDRDLIVTYNHPILRTEWTPTQVAQFEDALLLNAIEACPEGGCTFKDGEIIERRNHTAPEQSTAPAKPLHDESTPVAFTKGEIQGIVTQTDLYNLEHNPELDLGASTEDWHGPNATAEGISAHNVRMQSGITREGDHGEPTGALTDFLDVWMSCPYLT